MSKRQSNPGYGKAFTFHGSFVSLILARRREKEIPGSFIHQHKGRYYVLKPKKIVTKNPEYKYHCIQGSGFGAQALCQRGRMSQRQLMGVPWERRSEVTCTKCLKRIKQIEAVKARRQTNPRKKRACYVIPNPRTGTLIYGRVLKIFAQKTSGPYKGERFVHEFKPGALMYGMPDGSLKIIHK